MSLTAGAYEGDDVIVSRNLKASEEALQELDNTAQEINIEYVNIQGVTGGTDQTSGECSLGQTIPI